MFGKIARLATVKKFKFLRSTTRSPSREKLAKSEERRCYSEPGYYHSSPSQVRFIEDEEKRYSTLPEKEGNAGEGEVELDSLEEKAK